MTVTALPPLVEHWLAAQPSPNTRRSYRHDAALWIAHLGGTDLLSAQRSDIDAWQRAMERQPQPPAPATVSRRLAAVASLYAYLCALPDGHPSHLDRSPCEHTKRPKVSLDGTTIALDEAQAEALMQSADDAGPRTHVAVTMMLATAIRAAETLTLDVSRIRVEGDRLTIIVVRKGGREQVLPLPDRVAHDVEELRRGRERGRLLTLTPEQGGAWTYPQLLRAIRSCGKAAGLPVPVTPHVLRATWATVALAHGESLDVVQDVMGHASPVTTRRYDRRLRAMERRTDAVDRVWEALTTPRPEGRRRPPC